MQKINKARSNRAKSIAILGITVALIIILQGLAMLLTSVMPLSLALGLIPVLVVAQTEGTKYGAFSGFIFGLVSYIIFIIRTAGTPMFIVAVNPLVAIAPRILVGVVCGVVFGELNKLYLKRNPSPTKGAKKRNTILFSIIATLCGVLTNTILFLSMLLAFGHGKTFAGSTIDLSWVLAVVVALNTTIEILLFTFLTPFIVLATKNSKAYNRFKQNNTNLKTVYTKNQDIITDDSTFEDKDKKNSN